MANIRQVAEQAGVSVATVSRVLNGHNKVTPKTKSKVEQAIQQLNYEPSSLGRNLRKAESRLLLVLIPEISNPFYFEIIKGIETTALAQNYNILLCETKSDPHRENIYFDLVRSKMADGIISMDPAVNIERLNQLAADYPVIQCSEYDMESLIPYVTIDSEQAAYEAVSHLIGLGHENIALINSDKYFLYARQREAGYRQALTDHGIAIREDYLRYTPKLEFEYGQLAMRSLLKAKQRPTAVFGVSDILAIGALKEIHTSGLFVPDDIAVVGFDQIDFSNMTHPPLTTIAQPMYEMGTHAAEMMLARIQGEVVDNVILDYDIIVRESTIVKQQNQTQPNSDQTIYPNDDNQQEGYA